MSHGHAAESRRVTYQARTPDEVLEIDPATGKPLIITRHEPDKNSEFYLFLWLAIAVVVGVLGTLVLLFSIFFDIAFG